MTTVNLPYNFELRGYQEEPWDAILDEEFKRGILVVPRRNGKDILCWNALIAKAMQRRALYYYIAPYYNQVRQIIWEGFDKDGRRFLDYIPPELVANKTKLDMRIDLINGSQIKLQGSDAIDRIVGTNPFGIIFTEFSLHKPAAWDYLRPILAENGGWACFNGTPRGLNHFFELYQRANQDLSWYVQFLTRDDTGIPTHEAIEEDRKSGMPDELVNQEYYCNFLSGVVGAYYADEVQRLRNSGRITEVSFDPRLPVYTAWDLGVGDSTAIWFFQVFRQEIRLIDYYENDGEGVLHYIKHLKALPYAYEEHFAPFDIEVREMTTGVSRRETILQEHGLNYTVLPKSDREDGIEAVREILPRCWFDSVKCERGIAALMHYQKSYNDRTSAYSTTPIRNWATHGADGFRYLAMAVDTVADYRKSMAPLVNRSLGSHRKPRVNRAIGV